MDIIGLNVLTNLAGSPDIVVAGETTVYSRSIPVGMAKFFSLSYKAASDAGGINLKLEIEESFQLPTTECASDSSYKEPEGVGDIVDGFTTENTWVHVKLPLTPMKYFRLKITGLTGNSADTVLNAKLSKQEAA